MRTVYCGQVSAIHLDKLVTLCGWVNSKRNLGRIIFIEVRDREGIIQVVFESNDQKLFNLASTLRREFCIQIEGIVRNKKESNISSSIKKLEVLARHLKIFSQSKPLPMSLSSISHEKTRFKFRYLDLRRLNMIKRFRIRSETVNFIHQFMHKKGFIHVETPLLAQITPEGARSYLVASREYKGQFYALPQSPQIFKQLLMISGFDRYYQIARCFRDEDLRSDRQPEFTQVDIEMSFITSSKLRSFVEELISELWLNIKQIRLNQFPVITFYDAIRRYGSDRPDLRNPMEIVDIDDLFQIEKFRTFFYLNKKEESRISFLRVPMGANMSYSQLKYYINFARNYGSKNINWMKIIDSNNINSSKTVRNILDESLVKLIIDRVKAKYNDLVFFCADKSKMVTDTLGALRVKLGDDLNLTNKKILAPLWIIDFPMFKDNKNGTFTAVNNPFTAPKNISSLSDLFKDPKALVANSYDLIINGYEIGSGSVRINNRDIQEAVFKIIGLQKQEKNLFNFFLDALDFGTPPHAGLALGLDRIIMLLTETTNLHDVITFPKTTTASCLMTGSPNIVNYKSI